MLINRCILCSEPIRRGQYTCKKCASILNREKFDSFASRCEKCHYPKVSEQYSCNHCKEYPDFPVYSISDYSADATKRLLQDYKFLGDKSISKYIAYEFAKVLEKINDKKQITVVPVPSTAESLKTRGWDQMKTIAGILKRKYGYKVKNLITLNNSQFKAQKELTREERIESVKLKYCADERSIRLMDKDECIVLIDDVTTTGATLNACRETLAANGFSKIEALTWLLEL